MRSLLRCFCHGIKADQSGGAIMALLGASKLKKLCVSSYNIEDVEILRLEATASGTPLESLPPQWIDILAVIAYARRHEAVFQHLHHIHCTLRPVVFRLIRSIDHHCTAGLVIGFSSTLPMGPRIGSSRSGYGWRFSGLTPVGSTIL